jgi:glyoxylase-like metal-dependent hydrolase (beta-lactamase superfamily II)
VSVAVCPAHLHADFLSGARQLAHDEAAMVLAAAAGHRRYEHRGLGDGDPVDLGGLILTAWATPGHTDEHLAYLLGDGEQPLGVFTGGSLIVGSAARTDLLGADRARELAHDQYRSLQRLSQLPDPIAVWPTHGAGFFARPRRHRPHLHHRPGAGGQPAARVTRRGRVRRGAAGRAGQLVSARRSARD